jgi:SAM-dependent methyltransferase
MARAAARTDGAVVGADAAGAGCPRGVRGGVRIASEVTWHGARAGARKRPRWLRARTGCAGTGEAMSTDAERGQVSRNAAEVYDEFFVPALFGEWAERVAGAAGVRRGDRVLDVACGTGVLTRAAHELAGDAGSVVGLDVNPLMLGVASKGAPEIEWREGRAEALPFEDGAFDAVVSQFGLMFFEDRIGALREMGRVAGESGRGAVAVWASLAETPGYASMVGLLERLFGEEVADALRAPFVLGDSGELVGLLEAAGLRGPAVTTVVGRARFPSIESWVFTDIRGWTLADLIDDEQYERLLEAAQSELQPYVTESGSVEFASPAHIATFGG